MCYYIFGLGRSPNDWFRHPHLKPLGFSLICDDFSYSRTCQSGQVPEGEGGGVLCDPYRAVCQMIGARTFRMILSGLIAPVGIYIYIYIYTHTHK